jgi:hypothetical protein
MEPRRTEAEVLYVDGQWRLANVLGWHRLDVAHRQPLTEVWVFWLVHLRLESREEAWFEYVRLNLRPIKASSRSASSSMKVVGIELQDLVCRDVRPTVL